MISKKDQEMLLERIGFLDSIIDVPEETVLAHFNVSKSEAIQNIVNNLKHIVADLR